MKAYRKHKTEASEVVEVKKGRHDKINNISIAF